MTRTAAGLVLLVGSLCIALPCEAASPAAMCIAGKWRASGKRTALELKCVGKATGKGIAVDPACLAKAGTKFANTFAGIDATGGCDVEGDAAAAAAAVAACVTAIRTALSVPNDTAGPVSKCSAAKLKGSGKAVATAMKCNAGALTSSMGGGAACLALADEKLEGAFSKAQTKGDCLTMNDAAAIEDLVESCVDDVIAALVPPSTTTTTTVSSTTTTIPCDPEGANLAGVTDAHNDMRASADPTPDPPLDDLCYSSSLAVSAQSWADTCTWGHSGTPDVGENLYAVTNDQTPTAALSAVAAWVAEAPDYDYDTNSCGGPQCGHYTQIVWRDTTHVGCAVEYCTTGSPFGGGFPNWTIVVCHYDPQGNYIGEQPY